MQPRYESGARGSAARKHDYHPSRRPSLERALRELEAASAAAARPARPDYGCVDWYFYDEDAPPPRERM